MSVVQISIDSNCRFSNEQKDQEYLKLPHDKNGFIRCIGTIEGDYLYYKNKKVLSISELNTYCKPKYWPKEEYETDENDKEYKIECTYQECLDKYRYEFENELNLDNDDIPMSLTINYKFNNEGKKVWKCISYYYCDDTAEYCQQFKDDDSCTGYSVFLADINNNENDKDDTEQVWFKEIILDGIKITDAWLALFIYE